MLRLCARPAASSEQFTKCSYCFKSSYASYDYTKITEQRSRNRSSVHDSSSHQSDTPYEIPSVVRKHGGLFCFCKSLWGASGYPHTKREHRMGAPFLYMRTVPCRLLLCQSTPCRFKKLHRLVQLMPATKNTSSQGTAGMCFFAFRAVGRWG